MMTATEPRFLFPQSRQYPFDEVCEQIVRALDERGWDVPGLVLDFDVYGSGDERYRLLRSITAADFRMRFGRSQGRLGRWNDTAAISEIQIPRKEIHVFSDNSASTLYVYVGRSWSKDKKRFFGGLKVNSRLNGEPRLYLKYSGRRSSSLIADNDLDREYSPRGREPKSYSRDEVFAEFTQYLTDSVLAYILATPPVAPEDYLPPEEIFREKPNPWTDELSSRVGAIYCFGEERDAERVHQGKLDAAELEPSDRYAFNSAGYRLARLGTPNDGSIPKVAYDGFKWCTFGEVTAETFMGTLDVPGHSRWPEKEKFVFRVSPNRVDGVYVADHAPWEKRRSELFEEIKPRDRLTDEELSQACQARARTIMPIVEYALMMQADPSSAFEQPIVLINRELDFDEVELVSGPWPECQYVQIIADRSPAARAFLESAIAAYEAYYKTFDDEMRAAYDKAVEKLCDHFTGDAGLAEAADAYSRQIFRKVEVSPFFMERLVSSAVTSRRLGLL